MEAATMQPRMKSPVFVIPEALKAMQRLGAAVGDSALPVATVNLVHIRASQINGCSVCLQMHYDEAKDAGERDERLWTVAGWRDAPYFTDAERAALALTEAATRIADQPDPVPDEIWAEAARHYDEEALAALILQIVQINSWNRLNVVTRQVAGVWS